MNVLPNDAIVEIMLHFEHFNDIFAFLCTCWRMRRLKAEVLRMLKFRNIHLKQTELYVDGEEYRSFLNILGEHALEVTFITPKRYDTPSEEFIKKRVRINNYNAKKQIEHCKSNFTIVKFNFKKYFYGDKTENDQWKFEKPYLQIIAKYEINLEKIISAEIFESQYFNDDIIEKFENSFEHYCKDTLLHDEFARLLFQSIEKMQQQKIWVIKKIQRLVKPGS